MLIPFGCVPIWESAFAACTFEFVELGSCVLAEFDGALNACKGHHNLASRHF